MPLAFVNGVHLHYQMKGEGIPILFVPPPLLTGETFRYQQEGLSDEFRVITYDIRGHGESEASPEPLKFPLLARDIKQLIDLLGLGPVYICGYSTGGQLALAAMLAYPDRFMGAVLVSAMSEVSDWQLKLRVSAAQTIARLRLKRLLCSLITFGNADTRRSFRQLYAHAKKGHIASLGQYYKFSKQFNCTSRLRQVQAPVLLVYGKKDPGFFRYARILKNGLPHVKLHMIEGVKHQVPMKAARELNQAIRSFIREQQRRTVGERAEGPGPAAAFDNRAGAEEEAEKPLS